MMMNWVKRACRLSGLAGLAVLLAGLLSGAALADHAEGYCTEDGTAVVTYWPPGMEERYTASCHDGWWTITLKSPPPTTPTHPPEPEMLPDDFGREVFLILNRGLMVNPYSDVFPYISRATGRTLIPLRFVSEGIGATVTWNESARSIKLEWRDRAVDVVIGEKTARVSGREFALDQAPVIWKDRTMVPLRFLLEAFGAQIKWYDSASKVAITLPEANCPPTYCVH